MLPKKFYYLNNNWKKIYGKKKNVTLSLSPEARTWLRDKGYQPDMGARPLQRVVNDHIKKPLSKEILFGKLSKSGGVASVTLEEGKIRVKLTENLNKKEKALNK